MIHLPITLATAGVCGVLFVGLALNVVHGRFKFAANLGDAGHPEMLSRIRIHGNFSEYVPLVLILMALIEADGGNVHALKIAGAALVALRALHAIGMPMKAPNVFRASGAIGTFVLLVALSVWGFILAS